MFTIYLLPLVKGGEVSPYAITNNKSSPVIHMDEFGSVNKIPSMEFLEKPIFSQDHGDLDFLIREFCPKWADSKKLKEMLQ